MAVGALSAGPFVGLCLSHLGRKWSMITMAPVALLGWLLLVFA